ncbi:hypothetical protein JMM81_02600 [Bacillus sp. V3B]|uniref:capping complex subunit for YIEGIA n=1 Tax=Bacillus sp. V3B TaxID=2804915 RepID=UPI00210E9A79|nr:hypothetical protein [Bacillus sp. V3B]MCQ6273867.1 hypothetical protein [Bacillus sp. V3B]
MIVEKYILAVITTNPARVPSGATVFVCEDKNQMDVYATNLEAILDGIAHAITDEVYIIVKH